MYNTWLRIISFQDNEARICRNWLLSIGSYHWGLHLHFSIFPQHIGLVLRPAFSIPITMAKGSGISPNCPEPIMVQSRSWGWDQTHSSMMAPIVEGLIGLGKKSQWLSIPSFHTWTHLSTSRCSLGGSEEPWHVFIVPGGCLFDLVAP